MNSHSDSDLSNKSSFNLIIIVILVIVVLWVLSKNKSTENFASIRKNSNIKVTKLEELKDNLNNLESNKKDVLWRYGPESIMLNNVNEKIKEIKNRIELENKIQNIINKYQELVTKQNKILETKNNIVPRLNSDIDNKNLYIMQTPIRERNQRTVRMYNESITKGQNILNGMNKEEQQIRKQALEMQLNSLIDERSIESDSEKITMLNNTIILYQNILDVINKEEEEQKRKQDLEMQ
jgi:hypothetical protein